MRLVGDVLDEAGAREITERIKIAATALWVLLCEAHERQAWVPLGYPSFAAYVKTEFDMSRAHAYRVLDQAAVITTLAEAAGVTDPGQAPPLPLEDARRLKPKLAEAAEAVAEKVNAGTPPAAAVAEVAAEARETERAAKGPSPRSRALAYAQEHPRASVEQIVRRCDVARSVAEAARARHPRPTPAGPAPAKRAGKVLDVSRWKDQASPRRGDRLPSDSGLPEWARWLVQHVATVEEIDTWVASVPDVDVFEAMEQAGEQAAMWVGVRDRLAARAAP